MHQLVHGLIFVFYLITSLLQILLLEQHSKR